MTLFAFLFGVAGLTAANSQLSGGEESVQSIPSMLKNYDGFSSNRGKDYAHNIPKMFKEAMDKYQGPKHTKVK